MSRRTVDVDIEVGTLMENFAMTAMQGVQSYPENMVRAGEPTDVNRWAESIIENVVDSVEAYAREKPLPFAAWVFGIGFVIGWKLKPW